MDLINALTKARLDRLRPLPLVVEFTHADFPGPVLAGTVPAGHLVRETVVWVKEAFDGGVQITVGDMAAQARLQEVSDNQPYAEEHFNVNNVQIYDTDTDVYVFFPAGTPTAGVAMVVVFID